MLQDGLKEMIAPQKSDSHGFAKSNCVRTLLFCTMGVSIAILAWRMAFPKSKVDTAVQDKKHINRVISEVKAASPKTVLAPKRTLPRSLTRKERGVEVIAANARTNQSGSVTEKLTLADGRIVEKVRPPMAIFDNPAEQVIAMVLSCKPGQHMPPLPDLSTLDQDFADSFLDPIRLNDDDSEEVKETKLAVKEAKAYIAAEIRNGRTVRECLVEHREQMESIADSHLMAIQEVSKMREEGASEVDIAVFRCRVNEVFKDRGIPELPVPRTQEER